MAYESSWVKGVVTDDMPADDESFSKKEHAPAASPGSPTAAAGKEGGKEAGKDGAEQGSNVDAVESLEIQYTAKEAGDFELHVWCDPSP